jgi:hypothetical protein
MRRHYFQVYLSRSQLWVGFFSQGSTELLYHLKSVKVRREANYQSRIFTNGPAIWGGCVGALKRHGALFAVMVQVLLSITRVAGQV